MKSFKITLSLLFIIAVLPFLVIDFKAAEAETVFTDDFSTDSGAWQYLGNAYRDETDKQVILTTSGGHEAGVALFNAPIQDSFTASFRYKATGGDGIAMFFYKQKYSSLGDGGSLAFTSLDSKIVPGYGIEFDGWRNGFHVLQQSGETPFNPPQGDPSSAHIALIEGCVSNHLVYADDNRVEDSKWHEVIVEVQASSVTVLVDQEVVLEWTGFLNRTYSGFGFSGATGSDVGWHIIDDFSISSEELKRSVLTISCKGSPSLSDFNAQIDGYLTADGNGISDAPILLTYSFDQGKSWTELTLLTTNHEGYYSATWFPSVTGNYLLKTSYKGSNWTLGTSSEVVNFAVTSFETNTIFSVSSNSTVNSLAFNSTTSELSFVVTGPSETTGYVECTLAKSLVTNPENIKMFLDGNELDYTVSSRADMWLLYFKYNHSSHRINIKLPINADDTTTPNEQETLDLTWVPKDEPSQGEQLAAIFGIAAIVAALVVALLFYFKTRK